MEVSLGGWLVGVRGGWLWWVVLVAVVVGCDSRCGHRVLLDSVADLSQTV